MHHSNEEVHITPFQVIEKLQVDKFYEKIELTPKDAPSADNKEFNNLYLNAHFDKSLNEKCPTYEAIQDYKQQTRTNPIYDSEDIFKKSTPEKTCRNELHFSHNDSHADDEIREYSIETSTSTKSINKINNELYFNHNDVDEGGGGGGYFGCLDKTIDDAIKKYNADFEKNRKQVKDVSVQTATYIAGTTDKQCQCDLSLRDTSNSLSAEEQTPKKIRLNSYGHLYLSPKNANWKCESSELQQAEGNKKYFETAAAASQIKPSRIRDPQMMLVPQSLNSATYSKLVLLLSENLAWKAVAESFGIFSADDIQILMRNKQPAERLLFELGARLCTVDILCDVLRECQLYNILMLFKGSEPVKIIEQSYDSGDDNIQMVIRGQSFTLTAKALGIPPPTYQWYRNNVELSEETSSVLVLPHFNVECEGKYYCLIDQEGGQAISSNPVTLILAPERPVILKQPSSQEVCLIGSKLTLSVKAKGHPELNYQWYKGNQQLDGCMSPNLVVDVKKGNEDGKYRCYIYNSSGEVWSNECTVTIYTTPHPEPSAKLALLIANQLYENLNRLFTPENDVKTLADLLQDLGFLVISLQNLNLVEMRNAIKTFSKLLPSDAYVLFYFAGHGFEIQDKFMLPVDTPGAEDYLQTDAICERELLKAILSTNPKLFLQLLDMCLKPPSALNKKIFQETTDLYEYEANNNLIQGYSTTSYLGAYEKKTAKNGLYVEHLKKYLTRDNDLPVVEILQKVAKDVAATCMKQQPFFGTNVTMDYRLTDHCRSNSSIEKKFRDLSVVPPEATLKFNHLCFDSKVSFSSYMNVFLNTIEIRFTNLEGYRATCETEGEELSFELTREKNVLVIRVMNLQRLVTNKTLTLSLTKNDELMDCALLDLGKPMIAVADLWWNPDVRRREDENS